MDAAKAATIVESAKAAAESGERLDATLSASLARAASYYQRQSGSHAAGQLETIAEVCTLEGETELAKAIYGRLLSDNCSDKDRAFWLLGLYQLGEGDWCLEQAVHYLLELPREADSEATDGALRSALPFLVDARLCHQAEDGSPAPDLDGAAAIVEVLDNRFPGSPEAAISKASVLLVADQLDALVPATDAALQSLVDAGLLVVDQSPADDSEATLGASADQAEPAAAEKVVQAEQASPDAAPLAAHLLRPQTSPDQPPASLLISLARCLTAVDRFEEAILVCEIILLADPMNPVALHEIAWCYNLAGDYEEALENLVRALEVYEQDGAPEEVITDIQEKINSIQEGLASQRDAKGGPEGGPEGGLDAS